MELESLVSLCHCFREAGLAFWVDGGWGVDALIGRQTRPHSDLDLAVSLNDLPLFRQTLTARGLQRADRVGDPEWNWVFRHPNGESVDLHGFVLDRFGNGVLGDPVEKAMYPAGAFQGHGVLGDISVRCIAAPFVLAFRNSFDPRGVDRHDVAILCATFSLPLPSRYQTDEC